jgi:hypothetical protein
MNVLNVGARGGETTLDEVDRVDQFVCGRLGSQYPIGRSESKVAPTMILSDVDVPTLSHGRIPAPDLDSSRCDITTDCQGKRNED